MTIRTRLFGTLAAAAVLLTSAVALPTPAQAAVGSDFDPGNIISDAVFFDSSTMTADQIQQFLSLKGVSCVAGTAPCLKDYRTTTTTEPAEAGLCSGYAAAEQSAAEIIAGVARSCGINPRVLLVLLEKEQSLVTRTKPTTGNYQTATGFACPDSSVCNSQYFGLFNQLYMAGRQYQKYAANPSNYSYRAGRTNTILYNPNSACGTAQVYIANQASAGLYDYTPYVPNAAALSNLYGTGDGCSSYGNRNFWRLFTDWFGTTQANTYLMRSEQDATVYLVSGTSKYPIASLPVLGALAPLGNVSFVSQQYLDHHTTGSVVGRSLLGPDGTVWYFDAGIRLSFASCGQVEDYGMTCGGAVPVEAGVVSSLHNGGRMSNLFRTTSGKTYYVQGGKRHEAADDASLSAAGLPTTGVTLLESGVSYLPVATPVVRAGVLVTPRDGTGTTLSTGTALVPVPQQLLGLPGIAAAPRVSLDNASIKAAPTAPTLTPLMTDPTSGTSYLLSTSGKVAIDDAAAGATPTRDTGGALVSIPTAAAASSPVFVKTTDNGTVYLLRNGALRTLRSWSDLLAVAASASPAILTVPADSARLLPSGPAQVAPATLTIAPGNGTVYLMDGLDGKVPVGSFAVTDELGATRLVSLTQADLDRYRTSPNMASIAVSCGTSQYLGLAGRLVPVPASMVSVYNLSFVPLDPATCAALPQSSQPLGRFLRTPDGTIYYVDSGAKHPIASYGRYLDLGGNAGNTLDVTFATMAWFPTGSYA